MITTNRGGLVFDTGKIGRLKILRQDLIAPGETVKSRIDGQVRLESLRERDSSRINARFDRFFTPVRWLWSDYAAWLRAGPEASQSVETVNEPYGNYGLGSHAVDGATNQFLNNRVPKVFKDAVLRIYNEHYKWPEDSDATAVSHDGLKAMPLPMPWNRMRDDNITDADDYTLGASVASSVASIDIRQLHQVYKRFERAIDDEFLSFGRWKEYLDERYGTRGSSEIDQVPLHTDDFDLTVRPDSIPAMDGPSRGQWQALYDFGMDVRTKPFSANEHFIMTDILLVRYAPITEEDVNYLAAAMVNLSGAPLWKLVSGDPGIMAGEPLTPVNTRLLKGTPTGSNTTEGYLPHGWQWRTKWNQIGIDIDRRDSFPLMTGPGDAKRDATAVQDAFTSQAFEDFVIDINYETTSRLPFMPAGSGPGPNLRSIEPSRLV